LRKPRIDSFELFHGTAKSHDFFAFHFAGGANTVFQFDMDSPATVDLSAAAADGIDRDIAHDARRVAKKRLPIYTACAGLSKPNVRFVNQCSGIEQSIATATEPGPCNFAQSGIDRRR